jgi:hypothetical protein
MSEKARLMRMYGLCDRDDDCERGIDHAGDCGPKDPACPHPGACACHGEAAAS